MAHNLKTRSTLALAVVSFGLLSLTGCGPGRSGVKGTLVLPQGVELKDNDAVQVGFYPTAKGVGAGSALYNAADKTFVAKAPDGAGLPAGTYKISVHIDPYPGSENSEQRASAFQTINNNYSPEATKLTYDVTDAGSQSITVDLAKGTVTKN